MVQSPVQDEETEKKMLEYFIKMEGNPYLDFLPAFSWAQRIFFFKCPLLVVTSFEIKQEKVKECILFTCV